MPGIITAEVIVIKYRKAVKPGAQRLPGESTVHPTEVLPGNGWDPQELKGDPDIKPHLEPEREQKL